MRGGRRGRGDGRLGRHHDASGGEGRAEDAGAIAACEQHEVRVDLRLVDRGEVLLQRDVTYEDRRRRLQRALTNSSVSIVEHAWKNRCVS